MSEIREERLSDLRFRRAIAAALLCGIGLLIYGLWDHGLVPPWGDGGLLRLGWFSAAYLTVVGVCAGLGPGRRFGALVCAFALGLVAAFGIGPLGAVGLIGLAALVLGDLAFGRLWRQGLGLLPAALLSLCVGITLLMFLVGIAAHFPINFQAVYTVLLGIPVLLRGSRLKPYLEGSLRWFRQQENAERGEFLLFAALLFVLALHSVYAALPEQYSDSLALHLLVGTTMAERGAWTFDGLWFVASVTPLGADWVFALAYLLAGESAAKLMNLAFLGMIALLLGQMVGRSHGRRAGILAVLLFVSLPLSVIETISLFSENALTMLFLAAGLVLLRYLESLSRRDILALAVLLGGATLVKLHAFLFILPCACLLAIGLFRRQPLAPASGRLLLAAAVATLIGIQPYAYAYWATGNPVFPYFNTIFKSPFFDTSANFADLRWSGKLSWHLLYDWTFTSGRFLEAADGALGFTLLTLLPLGLLATLVRGDRPTRIATFLGLGYASGVCVLGQIQYLRYVYPAIPFLLMTCAASLHALPTAAGADRRNHRPSRIAMMVTMGLTALNTAFLPTAGWILPSFQADAVIVPRVRKKFMQDEVPQRHIIDILNMLAGAEANVLIAGPSIGAGLAGKPFYQSWYNPTFLKMISTARTPEEIQSLLSRQHISYAIIQRDINTWRHNMPLIQFLERFGHEVAKQGAVVLYDVRPPAGFGQEQLTNGDFTAGLAGWSVAAGGSPEVTAEGIILSHGQAVVQSIPASPKDWFLYTAKVQCGKDFGFFLLEINWVNATGKYTGTDGRRQYCIRPGPMEVSERFSAPDETISGEVFINVLSTDPVTLQHASLNKQ